MTEAEDIASHVLYSYAHNDKALAASLLRDAAAFLQPGGSSRPRGHFRLRVLISRGESVEADSEPGADIDAKPDWEVLGMAAISGAVAGVVRGFHAERGDGEPDLTPEGLAKRLPSLRVTLSRGNGNVWWRVPYQAGGMKWIAAVHVVRG